MDTMCSSSLTAIHLACDSLRNGSCELAVAGGVNVTVHPNKYLTLSQGQFAASNGRCMSFGTGGDGYVPGEGVGAVLLKPLARAVADGDRIYGVIKGTAINHGGKTNGYTVPNPQAQGELIEDALRKAGVHPRTISYVEAHGTGTALGDPIEVAGLSKAFGAQTQDRQYCAIGSAKSNIGHCESAAGIAGLTKVLLQLKHGQLVPSLHSEELNPNIDFARTPFVVQRTLGEWKRPQVSLAGSRSGSIRASRGSRRSVPGIERARDRAGVPGCRACAGEGGGDAAAPGRGGAVGPARGAAARGGASAAVACGAPGCTDEDLAALRTRCRWGARRWR
ncbi:polyketide synthase [Variovorax sp. NFACC27]